MRKFAKALRHGFLFSGFWARSSVISASVCVSGVQAPLTAQIIGGWYGHRCHIYSDCRINQLPSEVKLTVRGFFWCHNQANLSVQTHYCQSVKSELLETVGRFIDHSYSPLYGDVSSTVLHTTLRAALLYFFFLNLMPTDFGYSCVQKDTSAAGICLSCSSHCCEHEGTSCEYYRYLVT